MATAPSVSAFLQRVTAWASTQPHISGVALVGSHARGDARPDSDIDLVILCTAVQGLLEDTSWIHLFGTVESFQTEDWGRLTSLRVYYRHGLEVEFGLTTPAWAALPADPGSQQVVSHGMRILCDQEGRLGRLRQAVLAW